MNEAHVYDTLRQELLETYNRQVNLVTFTFTATAAIIGFALAAEDAPFLIYLLPLLILAPLAVHLNNSMYTILTISVYLRVKVESGASFPRWETDIGKLRAHLRDKKPIEGLKLYNPLILFDSLLYAVVTTGAGLACIAISFFVADAPYEYWIAAIVAILWIIASAILLQPLRLANKGTYEEKLEEVITAIDSPAASGGTQDQEAPTP